MPEVTLTETVSISSREVTDEEKYLAHRYNQLVDRCISWAGQQMLYGNHGTKLSLTKSVLSAAARLATLENKTQTEEHRVAFQTLLTDMMKVDAAPTTAIIASATDQDETGGDYTPERGDG